jgi:hypothetical protein
VETFSELESLSRVEEMTANSPSTLDSRSIRIREFNKIAMKSNLLDVVGIHLEIVTVQWGTYLSSPACLIVVGVLIGSPKLIIATGNVDVTCRLQTSQMPEHSNQSFLKYAPFSKTNGGKTAVIGVTGALEGYVSVYRTGEGVRWRVSPHRTNGELPAQLRLAIMVGHNNASFALEVTKSRAFKYRMGRPSNATTTFPFLSEVDESVLDDIDLEALTGPAKVALLTADGNVALV